MWIWFKCYQTWIPTKIYNLNWKNKSFKDITSGRITIESADKAIFSRNLDCNKYKKDSNYSSLLLGAIYKHEDEGAVFQTQTEWHLRIFEKLGFGHTFKETMEKLIDFDVLSHIYHDEDFIESRPNDRGKKYNPWFLETVNIRH